MTRVRDRQACTPGLMRYGIAAGICLALHNIILILSSRAGLGVMSAAVLSYLLLAVIGYLLLSLFAFRRSLEWSAFLRYSMAMATNFPLSTGLIWLLAEPLGQPMVVAAPASSVIMVLINYVGSRWAIIGRRTRSSASA